MREGKGRPTSMRSGRINNVEGEPRKKPAFYHLGERVYKSWGDKGEREGIALLYSGGGSSVFSFFFRRKKKKTEYRVSGTCSSRQKGRIDRLIRLLTEKEEGGPYCPSRRGGGKSVGPAFGEGNVVDVIIASEFSRGILNKKRRRIGTLRVSTKRG